MISNETENEKVFKNWGEKGILLLGICYEKLPWKMFQMFSLYVTDLTVLP